MFYSLHIENLTTGKTEIVYVKGAKTAKNKAAEIKARAKISGDFISIIRRNYRGEGRVL